MALWILSGTTRVSRYQKKHPPTQETVTNSHLSCSSIIPYLLPPSVTIHGILPVQFMCLTVFFHNLSPSVLWSTFWHPPLHTPYISSPIHCLLFTAHAHTIATCFAVVPTLCHLILVSLNTLLGTHFVHATFYTNTFPVYPIMTTSTLYWIITNASNTVAAFCATFCRSALMMTFVLFIFTLMPLFSTLSFHSLSLLIRSSSVSAIITKASQQLLPWKEKWYFLSWWNTVACRSISRKAEKICCSC